VPSAIKANQVKFERKKKQQGAKMHELFLHKTIDNRLTEKQSS
jgi:hypothetical protein